MKHIFTLIVCLLIAGCTVPLAPTIAKIPPPYSSSTAYIMFQADDDYSPRQRGALDAACAAWAGFTRGRVECTFWYGLTGPVYPEKDETLAGKMDNDSLELLFTGMGLGGKILGFAYGRSFVLITDAHGMDDMEYFKQVAIHEIGHTLGFHHVDGDVCQSIMYPYACAEKVISFGQKDWDQCVSLGYCRN